MVRSALCLLLLSATAFHLGEGTKCYLCTSLEDAACGDPFTFTGQPVECTNNMVKDLLGMVNSAGKKLSEFGSSLGISKDKFSPLPTEFGCSKFDLTKDDKTYVARGCSLLPQTDKFDPCKEGTEQLKKQGITLNNCEICNEEMCNAGSSLAAAFLLPAAALVLARL